MEVRIVHCDKNDWRIYPLVDDEYYLDSYQSLMDAKMYVSANFHTLKKRECNVFNCKEC